MPNKELGIADPVYDALRIRSGQSIAPDLGGGTTGAGGLENKIYVWHADGSTIDLFDPDEAGLILALAAAVSGDTIWLPSIDIPVSAAKALPAGVAMRGISSKAILTFSGFSGTAITMADNAICDHFVFVFTPSGNGSIGLDARFSGAVVNHVRGYILGSTTSDVGLWAGV